MNATAEPTTAADTGSVESRILSHEVRPDMLIRSGATGFVYRVLWVRDGYARIRRVSEPEPGKVLDCHLAELGRAGITLLTH